MSWSSTRPRRKTAATTRLKQMAANLWLNSWCRVSVTPVEKLWTIFVSDDHYKCTVSYHTNSPVALPLLSCHSSWRCSAFCDCLHHSAEVAMLVHMPTKIRRQGLYFTCTSHPVCHSALCFFCLCCMWCCFVCCLYVPLFQPVVAECHHT